MLCLSWKNINWVSKVFFLWTLMMVDLNLASGDNPEPPFWKRYFRDGRVHSDFIDIGFHTWLLHTMVSRTLGRCPGRGGGPAHSGLRSVQSHHVRDPSPFHTVRHEFVQNVFRLIFVPWIIAMLAGVPGSSVKYFPIDSKSHSSFRSVQLSLRVKNERCVFVLECLYCFDMD